MTTNNDIFRNTVTRGFSGYFPGLIFDGLPGRATPPATPANNFPISLVQPVPGLALDNATLEALQYSLSDVAGDSYKASPYGAYDLGGGRVLSFDSTDLSASITPALDPTSGSIYSSTGAAFSGTNCRIMIDIPQNPSFNGSVMNQRVGYQLIEATGITVSTHRSKSAVRALGFINPKGFARGSRTIAGTLMLNRFTREVLYRFIRAELQADVSKDTVYSKLDQLPPMNFTLLFSNEYGYISSQRLLGVEFVTDGTVISIEDVLLEQSLTYVAVDMTPMVPGNFKTLFDVKGASLAETSVGELLVTKPQAKPLKFNYPTLPPLPNEPILVRHQFNGPAGGDSGGGGANF